MNLHPAQVVLLFVAAAIAGTLNAVAGGGSFISFPVLLFTHVPAVQANATNTVALWPGLAASATAYFSRLKAPLRLLFPLLITSVAGGWAGALLLLRTPQVTFLHLVPWLLLTGTLLFTFGNKIRTIAGKSAVVDDLAKLSWRAVAATAIAELVISVYGGYFGAGIGLMIMGMLAALGMRDIHGMAAIRTVLSVAINATAVVTFIVAGAIVWPQCAVMIAGAISGGWFGARYAQKTDPLMVRYTVIGVGTVMTVYFFATTR